MPRPTKLTKGNSDKTEKKQKRDKRLDNPQTFKAGVSGNPDGRPKGSVGFKTLFEQAVKKIAKTENIKECDVEVDLIIEAIAKAKGGNFQFYKDIFDRNYGKAKDSLDVTSGGEKIYNWNYGDSNNILPKKLDKEATRKSTEMEGSSST